MGSLRASGLDLCYAIAAIATSPVWLLRMWRTGKIRTDWSARLGRGEGVARTGRPRIMLHAVSVGEVNAIRLLVRRLEDDPVRPEIFVATTTATRASSPVANAAYAQRNLAGFSAPACGAPSLSGMEA